MNARLTIATLIVGPLTALSASAVELANSGFMVDFKDLVAQPQPVSAQPPRPAIPVANDQVAPTPAPAAPQQGAGRRCVPSRPYKGSSPFKIHVDQINQTATVRSPDFPQGQELTFPVSTGGGVLTTKYGITTTAKIPDPASGVLPYCPQTGKFPTPHQNNDPVVTSFERHEFEGRRDCTEEEVRGRTTVFPGNTYTSTQFKALMPNALRFRGGQFFHRCPSGEACRALGQPNSGECVRVPGWQKPPNWMMQAIREGRMDTSAIAFRNNRYRRDDGSTYSVPQIEISETLVKQALKYGAYEVTISEPPPMRTKEEEMEWRRRAANGLPQLPGPPKLAYCDENDVAQAKILQKLLKERGEEPDGGWAAPNFGRAISDFFGGLFGGGQQQRQRVEPSRPETPEEKRQRLRRERQEQREREQWQRRVFEST